MANLGFAFFIVCALTAIVGALAVVLARNPIRGAMGLLLMIASLAGLFLALHAQFLAVIQLLVYAGAIVVLFLFVIMLLGPSATTSPDTRGRNLRALSGFVFFLLSAGAMYLVIRPAWKQAMRVGGTPSEFGSIDAIGRYLFTDGVVPFEMSSALLMVAIVGAVGVARGKQGDLPKKEAAK